MEISEVEGDDSESSRKYRINSAVPGSNVHVSGTVGVSIWKRELGGGRGDAKGPDSISTSGGATDHGDDGETWVRRRVGVSSNRGGDGLRRAPPHWSIHKEATDNHIREGGLPACICIFHRGG